MNYTDPGQYRDLVNQQNTYHGDPNYIGGDQVDSPVENYQCTACGESVPVTGQPAHNDERHTAESDGDGGQWRICQNAELGLAVIATYSDSHQLVCLGYELVGSPAFTWVEEYDKDYEGGQWVQHGSGPWSLRQFVEAHLRYCDECRAFVGGKLLEAKNLAGAKLLLGEDPSQWPVRTNSDAKLYMGLVVHRPWTPPGVDALTERNWRDIEMAMADALWLWAKNGCGESSYYQRIHRLWTRLFSDHSWDIDMSQDRARRRG